MQVLSIKENGMWIDLATSESRKLIVSLYRKLMREYHSQGKRVAIKIEKRNNYV